MADPKPSPRKTARATAAPAPLPPPVPVAAPHPGPPGEPDPSPWNETLGRLGFSAGTTATFVLGVLLVLVAKLLETIYANNQYNAARNSSDTGLLQAILWLGFSGTVLVSVGLLAAALLARRAHWGARLGLLVLGLSALLASSGSLATLTALFGSMRNGFPFGA